MQARGREEADIAAQVANVRRLNCELTRLLAGVEDEWPDVTVQPTYAIFPEQVEAAWPDVVGEAGRLAEAGATGGPNLMTAIGRLRGAPMSMFRPSCWRLWKQ